MISDKLVNTGQTLLFNLQLAINLHKMDDTYSDFAVL